MSRLKQLQNRDAAITAEMRTMSDALAAESRTEFSEDEQGKFDALCDESKKVQSALKVEESILANEKRLSAKTDIAKQAQDAADNATDNASDKRYELSRFAVPKSTRNLKAFKGADAAKEAHASGMFLLAAINKDPLADRWCRENGYLAQNESVLSQGGVLVPDVMSNAIINLRETYGVARQELKFAPMSSDTLIIPRRTAGTTAYFVQDGVATTESTKTWDGINLVAKELAALVRISNTLSEDAIINVADDVADEMAYNFAVKEDQCLFIGDGSLTYGGMLGLTIVIQDALHGAGTTTNGSTNGGVQVAAAGGTSFGATVLADYEKVVGLLPQYAAANAKWYFSRAGFASGPQRLMDAGGGNTNTSLGAGAGMQFLGYPVVISQTLNSTLAADASAIACLFGDINLAVSGGSRRDITLQSSSERYFEYRQIAVQAVERFDVNVHDLGTTTTAGPMVALKKSAS